MRRHVALLFIVLIVALTLVPAYYYPPDDEALRQTAPVCDAYCQLYTATGASGDFCHTHAWTGDSVSWIIAYRLPQYTPSSIATRAPPA